MAIELTDDGTMDTVLRCSECGEEMRYNVEVGAPPTDAQERGSAPEDTYDDFVTWAIADATDDHECPKTTATPQYFFGCTTCGLYHPRGWDGACKDCAHKYTAVTLPAGAIIVAK